MPAGKLKVGIISFAAAVGALALSAEEAHAASVSGYACSVRYSQEVGFGNYGSVATFVYSGANCSGTYLGNFYFCSVGGPSSTCHSFFLYRELPLMSLYDNLVNAATSGRKLQVDYVTSSSNGQVVIFNITP